MPVIRRLGLLLLSGKGLAQACLIKQRRSMRLVKLPPVAQSNKLSDLDVQFVLRCADCFVKYGALRTARKCFFRAFIIASVLRRNGMPVELNVGLKNMGGGKPKGHCWLSLNGKPFAERTDVKLEYPYEINPGSGNVRYWMGVVDQC